MRNYPVMAAETNRVEPVPRRVRGFVAAQPLFDTIKAVYVWEWPYYPQYYIPWEDIDTDLLVDEQRTESTPRGAVAVYGLRVGELRRPAAANRNTEPTVPGLDGMVRFEWEALDGWFEEDEQVFVHPRNPYVRVDALRSSRSVRVELDGVVLAESTSAVLVFETGLPTRYYVNRTDVNFGHLSLTETVTECPYKGTTTAYWSAHVGDVLHEDIAWSYNFPTRQLLPVTGMVAFLNERVDIIVDGEQLDRPEPRQSS